MNIDIEKLEKLVEDSDQIMLEPEGEKVLVQLLELQDKINAAISEAKLKLEEAALSLNPDFKSIRGDEVKVYYRQAGAKYKIDESNLPAIPKELYTSKTVYAVDSKATDKYAESHGGLPVGIIEPERPKRLSFGWKNKPTGDDDE